MIEKFVLVNVFFGSLHYEVWHLKDLDRSWYGFVLN